MSVCLGVWFWVYSVDGFFGGWFWVCGVDRFFRGWGFFCVWGLFVEEGGGVFVFFVFFVGRYFVE